jgi:hypothetical protein
MHAVGLVQVTRRQSKTRQHIPDSKKYLCWQLTLSFQFSMMACYCHRHCIPALWFTFAMLTVAGIGMFFYAGPKIQAQRGERNNFFGVTLTHLGGDVYVANTSTISVNCTLQVDPPVSSGYLNNECITDANKCYCVADFAPTSFALEFLLWFGLALVLFCLGVVIASKKLSDATRPICCCVPPYNQDELVCNSCHGQC